MSSRVSLVVGSFFGDEGKAKIVDFFSDQFDYVVRYQGGDNAGHTIYVGGKRFVFNLIPCGILRTRAVIAHGVVLNPINFLQEADSIRSEVELGGRLFVSNNVHIIFEWNILFDNLLEKIRNTNSIGTTGKGIGPSYAFKALRIGIRAMDLLNYELLREKITLSLNFSNIFFQHYGLKTFDIDEEARRYYEYGQRLKPFLTDTYLLLNGAISQGKSLLLEGSQGLMLDLDLGTYPFVTSSNISGSISPGTGLSPHYFREIYGVVKAYGTRVGNGGFTTEILDEEIANHIRREGNEYGSVTGRPRRIGWLDLVALKYSISVSGINRICLTLVDVLNKLPEVKACVAYRNDNGEEVDYYSPSQGCMTPVFRSFPGWKDDYLRVKTYDDFSQEFKDFVSFIEDFLGLRVAVISHGRERTDTIVR